MMPKSVFFTLLFLFFGLIPLSGQYKGSYKISSKLHASLDNRSEEKIHCNILLTDQVDLKQWENYFETNKTPYTERAKLLIKELKKKANNTQKEVVDFLENFPGVDKNSLKRHWLANAISVRVSTEGIKKLAAREDIIWIGENVPLQQTSYSVSESAAVLVPDGLEKGLVAINAPAMWALGYTGYGTKVFVADTGVDPTHPAISIQYNGNYFPKDQSWYPNPYEAAQNANGPFDCLNHGTHVTGTVLGLDRENNDTIGVAFNATWIGGAILCGVGTDDNIGAFEWAVDPDGDDNTTDDMPDAINNSWYDSSLNGLDCYSIYVPILETLELLGISVIFSAGNEGPDPGTITQPHNINISEINVFTVGALNGNVNSYPIGNFSSQGPSHCEGEGSIKIKPEVSAPGVSVRSSVPGNGYAFFNGTSMAAPHVAGSVLLLKEAFPYLGAKELKTAIYHSCTDLGVEGEDNTFGMGIINVYAAYLYLIAQGHVPVNPNKANDVVLLELKHPAMGCDSKVDPYIYVENAGSDTIYTLEVEYGTLNNTNSYLWEGRILPKQREYIQLPPCQPGLGSTELQVVIEKINGNDDEKPLNNYRRLPVVITTRQPITAEVEWKNNLCKSSEYILTSPLGAQGNHTTKWYEEPFGGEELFEGNFIQLNTNVMPSNLFAEVIRKEQAGKTEPEMPDSYFENAKLTGLIFDATDAFNIRSFDVYSEVKNTAEFIVVDENGDLLHSITKPNLPAGKATILVNWKINPGQNYRIVKKAGKAILSQKTNVSFPFVINNILTIKSGIVGEQLQNEYKSIFNVQVEYVEPCGRVPYHFTIRQDSVLATADFNTSVDTLKIPGSNTLIGTSLAVNASQTSWEMGDGTTYSDSIISHVYQNAGTYKICFHVLDENLCFNSGVKDIVVLESSSTNEGSFAKEDILFTLYPNPVNNTLFLETEAGKICHNCPVYFYDQRGINVLHREWQNSEKVEISTENWPSGVYFVKLYHPKGVVTQRFVKL
ncbi:MAG: S8 family serine peptidase [Saprospiraceae bacterium]|nr:S8 family serine peptidase [Saprospiraceae bacterium]